MFKSRARKLFEKLLEQEVALGLLPMSDDYFGTTQMVVSITDPCELDTEEYRSDWDTKKMPSVTIGDCGEE